MRNGGRRVTRTHEARAGVWVWRVPALGCAARGRKCTLTVRLSLDARGDERRAAERKRPGGGDHHARPRRERGQALGVVCHDQCRVPRAVCLAELSAGCLELLEAAAGEADPRVPRGEQVASDQLAREAGGAVDRDVERAVGPRAAPKQHILRGNSQSHLRQLSGHRQGSKPPSAPPPSRATAPARLTNAGALLRVGPLAFCPADTVAHDDISARIGAVARQG